MQAHLPMLVLAAIVSGSAAGQEAATNTVCPVMPLEEVNDESKVVTYQGKDVRLCCDKCVAKFLKDPGSYLDRLPQFRQAAGDSSPEAIEAPRRTHGPWHTIGKAHVVLIHFPLALLVVATALEGLAMLRRSRPYQTAVRPLLLIAAFSSCLAMVTGLIHVDHVTLAPSLEDVVFWHRNLGIAAAVLTAATVLIGEFGLRSGRLGARVTYRLALLAATACVVLAGHDGGLLVFGRDFWH